MCGEDVNVDVRLKEIHWTRAAILVEVLKANRYQRNSSAVVNRAINRDYRIIVKY